MIKDIENLEDKISRRKSLFFDTNIWIDLTEESDIQHKRVKKLLIKRFEEGKIFCPLYHDIIHELLKQEFSSALRIAEYMNILNQNIAFKQQREIFEEEILFFIKNYSIQTQIILSNDQIYVPILFYLSSKFEIDTKSEMLRKLFPLIRQKISKLTIVDLIESSKASLPRISERKYDVADTLKKRYIISGKSKKKAKRIEAEPIAKRVIIPLLNNHRKKLPLADQFQFCLYINSLKKDKFGGALDSILQYLPSINNYIEIMTVSGFDTNKNFSINDFHDINMLIVPFTYADIFVSKDGWIKDLVTNKSNLLSMNNTTFFYNFDQLELYLNEI